MSITCDFHLHSNFSSDSDTPMEDMIQAAIKRGLKTICFTEHMDLDYPEECGSFQADIPAYKQEICRLQSVFQDIIDIRFGIELGMQPHLGPRCAALAHEYPFDFIVASQHLVGGQDPYYRDYWNGKEEQIVYREYFSELLTNLQSMKEFDTVAHLDYIVRYGPNQNQFYSYQSYADHIDPILKYIIDQGKCLEVNTAGLKYGLKHPNPEESVLKRYRELGGERITIGSDAHQPEHIAYDSAKAEAILKELGFQSYCIFHGRKPNIIPL